jgi:iron-sulfur cluster assembly protein
MMNITPEAAMHIRTLLAEQTGSSAQGLRLTVTKGGCAGHQYIMTLGSQETGDQIVTYDDAYVFMDTQSIPFLEGCTLAYENSLTASGFRIINPQAARSCGCGTSFEPQ